MRTLGCCPLMTGLLLLLFRWPPYGGAGRIGTPKAGIAVAAVPAAAAAATTIGGGAVFLSS